MAYLSDTWDTQRITAADRAHIWHPYDRVPPRLPPYPVASASGVRLRLADGRELIDGMSSWWCAIHGYNVPELNAAVTDQLQHMAHVMFGGLTHQPAVELAERLAGLAPAGLTRVFFADSGSVSVEVAMKLALQYWQARERPGKRRLAALRRGYHGDTSGAMSVCDPDAGMHSLFRGLLAEQVFVPAPTAPFAGGDASTDIAALEAVLAGHHQELAALILEPIAQNTGGMHFYSPEYLRAARALCDQYEVLLIADEIATGFGRTGELFGCDHAGISPDIMCVGKALTGGYMTLAAVLCGDDLAHTVCAGVTGALMHGPTFMANPLATRVALASLDLLLASPWRARIAAIETALRQELTPLLERPYVSGVRVLGAIGAVELTEPLDLARITPLLVDNGVWLRPFGRLLYTMPPFVITPADLRHLTGAMEQALSRYFIGR